jgi:DNA adenine methylase
MADAIKKDDVADPGDVVAVPLLKFAGGKRQLLAEIREHVPATFNRYLEPFVGGGAVFFDLFASGQAVHAYLGDVNTDLVATYKAIRNDVGAVIAALRAHERQHSEEYYYVVRAQHPRLDGQVAARMIYLNRTCFNGLYRVNRSGAFNVPFGRYVNPTVCDEENLRACAHALASVEIAVADFASVMAIAKRGDFVYCDPPYVPASKTGDFTSYTASGFTMADQERLASCARQLKESGVHVLLSNADVPVVRELYSGFETRTVRARRNINSNGGKRGDVGELLIW